MNRNLASNILRQRAASAIVLLVALAAPLHAQDSPVTVEEEAVVTEADATATTVRPAFSSVPGFIQDMRRTLGFSVGAYGSYDPSTAVSTTGEPLRTPKSVWVTPQLFANIRRKRSLTYLNYVFEARAQSGTDPWRGSSHTGSVRFTRALSRRTSFALDESLTSAMNDRRTFVRTATSYQLTASQDLDVAPQRVTQNTLSASIGYEASRRMTLGFFGGYDFWHYGSPDIGDAHGISVGIRSGFRINRWLYLDNTYSHYLNLSQGNQSGTTQLHQLQVGGLRLARSLSGWEASVSGGADISSQGEHPRVVPSAQVALVKSSDSNQFSLTYRRGLWTAVGPGATLEGDTVTAAFSQAVRRMNVTIEASYRRGAGPTETVVDYFTTVSAQVGFAIQRHLMLTADYWYVAQHVDNLGAYADNVHRYRVSAGITYVLPSLFNR